MRVRPFIVFASSVLFCLVLFNVFKFKSGDTCDFYPCDYSNVKYYSKKMLLDCAVDVVPISSREEEAEDSTVGTSLQDGIMKSIGPNKTFWVYFYGDSVLRDMFVDLLSLVNNTQLTAAPPQDCVRHDVVREKDKCVCWDYTLPLYRFDLSPADNKTLEYRKKHKPPPVAFIRLTYRAKHKIYQPLLDEEILKFEHGCDVNVTDLNVTESGDLDQASKMEQSSLIEGVTTRANTNTYIKNITKPNFLLINSGLWDILYERDFEAYKKGGVELLKLLKEINAKHNTEKPKDPTTTTTTTTSTGTTQATTTTTTTNTTTTTLTTGTSTTNTTNTTQVTNQNEDDKDGDDDDDDEDEEVTVTHIMFVGTTAVVPELLPYWKRPFLANNRIQLYNEYILQLMKDNGVRVLDTFKITHLNEEFTKDGIHFPGIISRTNTNMALNSLCP